MSVARPLLRFGRCLRTATFADGHQRVSLNTYARRNGIAQTTAPTTQSIYIRGEAEQVGADAADLAEALECLRLCFIATVGSNQSEGEDSRIVLRRTAA